eukprot:scaffold64350_cov68-Phaeocystis_antarctica.AAC.2
MHTRASTGTSAGGKDRAHFGRMAGVARRVPAGVDGGEEVPLKEILREGLEERREAARELGRDPACRHLATRHPEQCRWRERLELLHFRQRRRRAAQRRRQRWLREAYRGGAYRQQRAAGAYLGRVGLGPLTEDSTEVLAAQHGEHGRALLHVRPGPWHRLRLARPGHMRPGHMRHRPLLRHDEGQRRRADDESLRDNLRAAILVGRTYVSLLGLPAGVAHVAPPRTRLPHHAPLLDPVEAVARGRDRSAGQILDDESPLVPVHLHAVDDEVVLLGRPRLHVVVLPSWHR